jgi:hypothetical protein
MRNMRWVGAGLCLRLLVSAGPSFADGGPPRTTSASATAPARDLRPPIYNGAATAEGGVQVAVLRQRCSQTVETEQPGNDFVETIIELEFRNRTSAPIAVRQDRIQLVAPDGRAIRTSTWFAGSPRPVEPGQAQTFELRFVSRGGLSCYKEMILEPSSAVVKGTAGVKIDPVRLAPAEAPSGYGASLT